jgi:hypothetical protein
MLDKTYDYSQQGGVGFTEELHSISTGLPPGGNPMSISSSPMTLCGSEELACRKEQHIETESSAT